MIGGSTGRGAAAAGSSGAIRRRGKIIVGMAVGIAVWRGAGVA